MAATFLPGRLVGGLLQVQAAWGADLTADPASWSWTDISGDVRQGDGINLTHGRSGEATRSQPATCTLTLDNRAGDYSRGPQSANHPNVRRGTPVRVRVDTGSGYTTAFQGNADGWSPGWAGGPDGDAIVTLTASGALRRLAQGTVPVISAYRRAMLDRTDLLAYWPCEDGKSALTLASAAVDDVLPISIDGLLDRGTADVFPCSAPMTALKAGFLAAQVPAHTSTGEIQVRCLAQFPDDGLSADGVLLRIWTTGTAPLWELGVTTAGSLRLRGWDDTITNVYDSGNIAFQVNGRLNRYSVELVQDGADIDIRFGTLEVESQVAFYTSGALAGETVGAITGVVVNPGEAITSGVPFGHLSVQNAQTSLFDDRAELDAYSGENATARITRLCGENNIPVTVTGSSNVTMGPQTATDIVTLLRECETADQGVLYDGVNAGLTYLARDQIESAAATLTVDATAGEVARRLDPVDDDARTLNRATATRRGGSTEVFADTDGVMGTDVIGIYESSITVATDDDTRVIDYAGWLVHAGTLDGYRHPNLELDLAHTPSLAAAWRATPIGGRVDLTGVSDVYDQHPDGTVPLVLEGTRQRLSTFEWVATANVSPHEVWSVGEVATATGDTNEFAIRLAGDGSTLASSASAGATSLSVTTAAGPLWSTVADDYPLDLDVGGVKVTATACSGAASPQTFTVTAIPHAVTAGDVVDLWRPAVLGL